MRRLALLLALALIAGACATTATTDETLASGRTDLAASRSSGTFMKGISESVSDHFADCGKGLSFTWNALSRRTRSDWTRFVGFFR